MKTSSFVMMMLSLVSIALLMFIFFNNRVSLMPAYKWMLVAVGVISLLNFIFALSFVRKMKPSGNSNDFSPMMPPTNTY
jgi:hypothetical protein